jgi:FkbM family methyltransferase
MKNLSKVLDNFGYSYFKHTCMPYMLNHCMDIKRFVNNPEDVKTIFDIGANLGQSAAVYSKQFPWARIISYEPVRSVFVDLEKNVNNLRNVQVRNCAIGKTPGKATIFHGPCNLMSTLKKGTFSNATEELVEVVTIDNEILAGIPCPDFIKIDTEGFEMDALAGAQDWLCAPGNKFLLLEVTFRSKTKSHPLLSHQTSFFDAYSFLAPFDFEFVGIYDPDFNAFSPPRPPLSYCNALFAKIVE